MRLSNRKKYVITFLLAAAMAYGQDTKSKADELFFAYDYREAINEYYKEMNQAPLTNQQQLNLADSFLKIGNYKEASERYLEVYKADSTMSNHHFNKMLQAMVKISGIRRARAFMATRSKALTPELLENADFNYELFQAGHSDNSDVRIFNLNANSAQADFSPAFYGDKFLFSSGRPRTHKNKKDASLDGYLDIYVAKVGLGGQIINPNTFTGIPDSPFHEATPYYSQELNTIFYILSNANNGKLTFNENGKNALALGMAEGNGTFRYLLRDLSTSFYYPFYDFDNGKLYFAANFEDSYGGTDIYYVHTNNGLIMSSPVNLGPRINTPGNEIAPYIFENSLYFSSDIFFGLGGMDIYKSEMGEDDFFSIPVNLGQSINSEEDDFGLIIRKNINEGLLGYFSSNRIGGKGDDDIYGFLANEKPGIKTLVIRGEITRLNSVEVLPKVSVKLLDAENKQIREVYTNADGTYWAEIPWRDQVNLQVSKNRYSIYNQLLDSTALQEVQNNNNTLNINLALLEDLVQEKEEQIVLKLNKFFFDTGGYTVTPEIAEELDKAVDAVAKFPRLQLRIEAHTDSRGSSSSNLRLSQRRADAMKKYLLDKGVPADNIPFAVGYGEEKITNNCLDGVYCLEILHKQNERQWIVVANYDLLNQ